MPSCLWGEIVSVVYWDRQVHLDPCWSMVKPRTLSWELKNLCCRIQASLLSKLYNIEFPSLAASLKSFQVAVEAGNFIVQESLQRSKPRSFTTKKQVCECYSKLKAFLSGGKGSGKDSIWSLLSSKAETLESCSRTFPSSQLRGRGLTFDRHGSG